MINDNILFKYKNIFNKLINLTQLLRTTLEECGVNLEGKENASFYDLLKCVVKIDSVAPKVNFNNFKDRREHKHFFIINENNHKEDITNFLLENKKIYYLDYVLLDKILFYMSFLRWYLTQMNVPQVYINEATTLKSLILLLKKIKIYQPTSIVINELNENNQLYVRVNKENIINFSVISDIDDSQVPLYTITDSDQQALYNIKCISSPNYNLYLPEGENTIQKNIITPKNIMSSLPHTETYVIEFNGYSLYKPSTITFDAIIIENPYEITELTVQNVNELSNYYQSENEGYISDTWQIDVELKNDQGIGITGKQIYLAIEDDEPFASILTNQGNATYIGTIPYVNNDFIDYNEYDKPNAIRLYTDTQHSIDYTKSKKIYITDEQYEEKPLNNGSIIIEADKGLKYYYAPITGNNEVKFRIDIDADDNLQSGVTCNIIYDIIEKTDLNLHIYTDFDPKYDTEEFYAINLYYEPVVLIPELIKYKGYLNDIDVTLTFRDIETSLLLQDHIYDNETIIVNNKECNIQNSQAHFIIPSNINEEMSFYITLHKDTDQEMTLIKDLKIKSNFILPTRNTFSSNPSIYYKPQGQITQSSIIINDNDNDYTIMTDENGKLLLTEDFSSIGTHNLILYSNTNDNVNEVIGYKYRILAYFEVEEEYNTNSITYNITFFDNTTYSTGDYVDYIQIINANNETVPLSNPNIIINETEDEYAHVSITIKYDTIFQGTNKFITQLGDYTEERTFILHPTLVEDLDIQEDGNLIISAIFANDVDNTELGTDLEFSDGSIYLLQTIIEDPDHIDEVITEINIDENNNLIYKKIKDL